MTRDLVVVVAGLVVAVATATTHLRRRPGAVRLGQVVVVLAGPPAAGRPTWIVQRVHAVPGDPGPADIPRLATHAGATVPAGRLIPLGDNPPRSADSRQHGYYRLTALTGTVVRRLAPLGAAPAGHPAAGALPSAIRARDRADHDTCLTVQKSADRPRPVR